MKLIRVFIRHSETKKTRTKTEGNARTVIKCLLLHTAVQKNPSQETPNNVNVLYYIHLAHSLSYLL